MKTLEWFRRHPLSTYFLLTFLISWGAELAVLLPTTGIPAPATSFVVSGTVFAASIVALLLGPPTASLATTALVGGRAALRELRHRMGHARVPGRFYAAALIAPLSLLAVLAPLSAQNKAFLPGALHASTPTLVAGLCYAVAAGFFEELGWTGFATPRLIARWGAVRGALALGVVWTIWHILPVYTFTARSYGPLYLPSVLQGLVFLSSFRVVMTLIYERTRSVLVAQWLHFSLTASSILLAPSTTPAQGMIWNSLWPLALAFVALAMAMGRARLPMVRRTRTV